MDGPTPCTARVNYKLRYICIYRIHSFLPSYIHVYIPFIHPLSYQGSSACWAQISHLIVHLMNMYFIPTVCFSEGRSCALYWSCLWVSSASIRSTGGFSTLPLSTCEISCFFWGGAEKKILQNMLGAISIYIVLNFWRSIFSYFSNHWCYIYLR